ncbi:MAG: sulfatase-like hydrolase/transferase [Bacteroidales bacterium]|nr:sulfatase-like hydrolase/transferase [Bacteroidales bacterium]
MKKRILTVIILLFAGLITYLLWPLRSNEYPINWDEKKLKAKNDFLAGITQADPGDSLPNILFILVDDLGLYDMSYYGSQKIQTPHMDNIAQSGIAFDQAYVASPMCSASRASILTGRYPQRFGFQYQMHDRYLRNRLEYLGFKYIAADRTWQPRPMNKVPRQEDIDKQGLPPSEITIADMLKARGYATALIGKWHTGSHEKNLPSNFGFDFQYGFFDAHTLYAPAGKEGITDQRIEDDFTDQYNWDLGRSGTRGIYRNYERIDEQEHLTDAITRESIRFMNENTDRPFFLMAAYNAPHTPLQAPDHYVEMFKQETDPVKRVYHAMIRQLDDAIGRLLDAVDELDLEDNTLVIFLSDNGGATYTHTTDNGPLRGGKITDFEGGIRVPFFLSWKGRITAGLTFPHPVMAMDLFATIASVAGCPMPAGRKIDGEDLLQYVENVNLVPHKNLYWQRGSSKAVRSGEWKVIWNEEFGDTLVYHIADDPFETSSLTPSTISRHLTEIHAEWSYNLPEPLWPAIVYYREWVDDRWVYFNN